mgnify:CR=1 FL=1
MKALKTVEVKITINLTKYEAEWLCAYLYDYSGQEEDEYTEDTNIRRNFFRILKEALDLPENT